MEHKSSELVKKDLDTLLSKISALEAASADEHQRGTAQALRIIAQGQLHTAEKFEHVIRGMDMMLQQIFELQNDTRSLKDSVAQAAGGASD